VKESEISYPGFSADFRGGDALLSLEVGVDGVIEEHVVLVVVVFGLDSAHLCLVSEGKEWFLK
jgi:hypothetical protein